MGNNKGTEQRTILIVENYFASGMGLVEYAKLIGIDRTTLKSMEQRFERVSGRSLPERSTIRNEEIALQFKKDMEEGRLPEVELPARRKESNKMNNTVETKKEEASSYIPTQKREVGRPGLDYKEAKFSFSMKEADFNLLKAYCTLRNKTIKEVMQCAIYEYLGKPENKAIVNEAEKLVKLIEKTSK